MELPVINYQQIIASIGQKYQQLLMQFTCCDLCTEPCTKHLLLCQSCFDDLPIFDMGIVKGDLLNWPAINKSLPKIDFDHLICLSPYTDPFDQWISQLKYHGRFELAKLLADLLSSHYLNTTLCHPKTQADLVVSVPLHITKWQQRGFNQAHLLSAVFAPKIGVPYDARALSRNKITTSQMGQSGESRRKNLQGVFDVNLTENNIPEHVLLIDDVVTTGATASAISRCLKLNGVKRVSVLAICLSLPVKN